MTHSSRLLLQIVALLLLAACGSGKPLTDGLGLDTDGDGVVNGEDCAPNNADVWGDDDGDGWLDARCLDAIEAGDGYPVHVPGGYTAEQVYLDCDDDNAEVHPGGTWTAPEFYEHRGEVDDNTREVCKALGLEAVPTWAYDGVDNDCDGLVDVPDFDGDLFSATEVGGGDCDDCVTTVNLGMDETLMEGPCPIYAYDGIDNDCDGSDLNDLDGDGQAGRWDVGSECGATRNQSTDDTPMLSDLTAGNEDCYDLRDDIKLGAPEFCDWVDHDCNGTGDALNPDNEEVALNGFEIGEVGLRVVHVSQGAASPPYRNGIDPEHGFETVTDAATFVGYCREVAIGAGLYTERILIDAAVIAEGPDSKGEDPGVWLRFVATEDGVELDGDEERFLTLLQGPADLVEFMDVAIVGGEDLAGGLTVEGGTLSTMGVSVSLVEQEYQPGLGHIAGVSSVHESLYAGNNAMSFASAVELEAHEIVVSASVFTENSSDIDGGALVLGGFAEASVTESSFTGNESEGSGGALTANGGALTLSSLEFTLNRAAGNAGAVDLFVERATLSGLDASSNAAESGDGGALRASAASVSGTTLVLQSNQAAGSGGAIRFVGDRMLLEGIELDGNLAGSDGGGLHLVGTDIGLGEVVSAGNQSEGGRGGAAYVVGSVFDIAGWVGNADHAATGGGGLYLVGDGDASTVVGGGDLSFADTYTTAGPGGAIFLSAAASGRLSSVHVDCSGFTGAAAESGGALAATGLVLSLADLDISGCSSTVDGGGLAIGPVGTVEIAGIELEGNETAGRGGGAFMLADSVTVTSLVAANNSAGEGGGLYLATVTGAQIEGVQLQENQSRGDGGGLYLSGGAVEIVGAEGDTFEDNRAGVDEALDGRGGGLFAFGCRSVSLEEVAVTAEGLEIAAHEGGGLAFDSVAAVSLRDVGVRQQVVSGGGGCVSVASCASFSWVGTGAEAISECEAAGSGGGLLLSSAPSFDIEAVDMDSVIARAGAFVYATDGVGSIADSSFTRGTNTSSVVGLGPTPHWGFLHFESTDVDIMDTTVRWSEAEAGADSLHWGISGEGDSLISTERVLVADNDGGGIHSDYYVELSLTTVANNTRIGVDADARDIEFLEIVYNGEEAFSGDTNGPWCSYAAGNGDDTASGFATGTDSTTTGVASYDADWAVAEETLPDDADWCPIIPDMGLTIGLYYTWTGYAGAQTFCLHTDTACKEGA